MLSVLLRGWTNYIYIFFYMISIHTVLEYGFPGEWLGCRESKLKKNETTAYVASW